MNSKVCSAGIALVGGLSGHALWAQEALCDSPIGMPHLVSGGPALCEVLGEATVFALSNNTELAWDGFAFGPQHELQFNFSNPAHTVVNRSLGQAPQVTIVAGRINSNGNVVLLSPQSLLSFHDSAQVRVGSFVAAGMEAEASQFFEQSQTLEFRSESGTQPITDIRGEITTTSGDVILVGKDTLFVTATIDSAGAVRSAAGERVTLSRTVVDEVTTTGLSEIIQGGRIEAGGDIGFVAQEFVSMVGEHVPGRGRGRVFTRVGDRGNIEIGNPGLTVRGRIEFSKEEQGAVAIIGLDEGDDAAARTPAVNEFPTLRRTSAPARTRPTSGGVTARTGTGFSRAQSSGAKKGKRLAKVQPLRKRRNHGTLTTLRSRKK